MQVKDFFSKLYKLLFDTALYTVLIAALLGALPYSFFQDKFDFRPERFDNEHLYSGIGNHKWNNDLVSKADILFKDDIMGAESFAVIGDYIYTGLADGRIVRIDKRTDKIEDFLRLFEHKDCLPGVYTKIAQCGRPLGLREHPDGSLFVIEANTGLYRINVTTKEQKYYKLNYEENMKIVYNDLVFDREDSNIVYITVSTVRWGLDRLAYSIFEHDNSGYVMAANLKTGDFYYLTNNHFMPNGIEITADGKYLLFSLTGEYAIKKINMEDVRKSIKDKKFIPHQSVLLFGDLLPGEPDNIRLDRSTGDILVGMFTTRPVTKITRDYLGNWPKVRKSLARTMFILSQGLSLVNSYIPNHAIEQLAFDLYSGHIIYKTIPFRDGAVLKVCGKTGQIKNVLGSNEFNSVSEAIVDNNGDLYFGSFRNRFIGRIRKGSH